MSETEQTQFWRGEFGTRYIQRNLLSPVNIRQRTAMWARVLERTSATPPASVLEVGANIGINIASLRNLVSAEFHAVEPNETARRQLRDSGILDPKHVYDTTGDNLPNAAASIDLVFTSGVLIHVAPDRLEATCREMHRVSRRYIGCIEYFSTTAEEKLYHGHAAKLFKRDFGGFWWDLFPDLKLVDNGFFWRRTTGLDDLTWWLFEKP